MDKVCIMMSTYNGEKFINEQIDSIISQKNVRTYLLIRDDGSTDRTIDILEQYIVKYPTRIRLIKGENIGWMGSFYELTYFASKNEQFDFYAYSDQDDVWLPDKLISGINRLKRYNDKAAFYYANRMVVTENKAQLYEVGEQEFITRRGIKKKILVPGQVIANGCVQIFNHSLLKISTYADQKSLLDNKIAHDQWMGMVAVYFGQIEYENKICILHRQHENSTTNSGKRRIRSLALDYAPCAKVFASTYLGYELLKKTDKVYLSMVLDYRTNFIHKLKLLLDSELRYESILGSVKFKIAILFSVGL